jgi:hypothetical protein
VRIAGRHALHEFRLDHAAPQLPALRNIAREAREAREARV